MDVDQKKKKIKCVLTNNNNVNSLLLSNFWCPVKARYLNTSQPKIYNSATCILFNLAPPACSLLKFLFQTSTIGSEYSVLFSTSLHKHSRVESVILFP